MSFYPKRSFSSFTFHFRIFIFVLHQLSIRMKSSVLLFLAIILLASCTKQNAAEYIPSTAAECDSLLATPLSPRHRAVVLKQAAQLNYQPGVPVSSKAAMKSRLSQKYIDEAIAIAPADMLCDLKIDAIHHYTNNVRITSRDTTARRIIQGLITDIENYRLTTDQKASYMQYKIDYYVQINAYREALALNNEVRSYIRANNDKQGEAYSFLVSGQLYYCLKDYQSALAYCDSARNVSGYTPTEKMQQKLYRQYSIIYKALRKYDKAIEAFRKGYTDTFKNATLIELYIAAGRHTEALNYINIYKETDPHPVILSRLAAYEASVWEASGNRKRAALIRQEAIRMAEENAAAIQKTHPNPSGIPPAFIPVYAAQARWEWDNGHSKKAIALLSKAQALENSNQQGYIDMLEQLSGYHISLGNFREALYIHFRQDSIRQEMGKSANDSIYREIIASHEAQLLNATIDKQQLRILSMKHDRTFFIAIAIALAVTTMLFFLLYRQRQRTLSLLYRKQKELEQANIPPAKRPEPVNAEERLFRQIEKEMITNCLFANPAISLDELSRIAHTNRTYVSAAINRYAGGNFNQWVNRLRIEYVLAHIHDTDSDSLASNAGFASYSSLYRHFKAHTGMTMKQYISHEKRQRSTRAKKKYPKHSD